MAQLHFLKLTEFCQLPPAHFWMANEALGSPSHSRLGYHQCMELRGSGLQGHSERHSPNPHAPSHLSKFVSCHFAIFFSKILLRRKLTRCEASFYFPAGLQKGCSLSREASLLTCLRGNDRRRQVQQLSTNPPHFCFLMDL